MSLKSASKILRFFVFPFVLAVTLLLAGAVVATQPEPRPARGVSYDQPVHSGVFDRCSAVGCGDGDVRERHAYTAERHAKAIAKKPKPTPSPSALVRPQSVGGNAGPPVPSSCASYSGNRATGCALLLQAGWGLDQMGCLNSLWTRESGWNHLAQNPSSGAYGIPQSLPPGKMASVGSDWQTNPATQIQWGLGYIKGRYGSPCGAWAHSERVGWY